MTMMLDRVLSFELQFFIIFLISFILFCVVFGSRGTADIEALSYAATTPQMADKLASDFTLCIKLLQIIQYPAATKN